MILTPEQQALIRSPDSVDFVVRQSEHFFRSASRIPNLVVAQTLTGGYLLCYIDRKYIESLATILGQGYISSQSILLGTLDDTVLDISGISQIHEQPYLDLKGSQVLVGIVDTGIDYTQPVFLRDDGTSKILFIYDQTGTEHPPESFVFGTEYTNEQINAALNAQSPFSVVPQTDTFGHGTFLASVSAGKRIGNFSGSAPDADIIAVKLQKAKPFYLESYAVPEEQENAFSSSAVMVGVEYLLQKAHDLGRPISICIGLGSNFGGHDGYSIFEEYLSGGSSQRGVCLCIAAGNESQARHHMDGKLARTGDTMNVDLRIGEDAGDVIISLWSTISDRLSVSVRSPSGELVNRIPAKPGPAIQTKLILERSMVSVRYFLPLETSGAQLAAILIRDATPGIWTITVHGDIVLDGAFHCWLPLTGFVSPNVEFISATPYFTVTVPSTMLHAICCGAYNSFNNSLYINTSWGPTRTLVMAPDLVAPGVAISGYFPTGPGLSSGTSAAAAITTGACALLLQWGVVDGNDAALSTYQIRAYLIRGCARSASMAYPNTKWGYGKLDLMSTFHFMREL